MSERLADRVAKCVLDNYDSLPPKCRIHYKHENRKEWTILSGIVLFDESVAPDRPKKDSNQVKFNGIGYARDAYHDSYPAYECVSLATGTKCLPRNKLESANGNILHDWHAEILCIRGFNRWLLDECSSLLNSNGSRWLQLRELERREPEVCVGPTETCQPPAFELKDGISIHMFTSAAPCGDASMELIMATQADATPWRSPAPSADPNDMLGRGQFDQLGAVRRKPSRSDAPVTWSKSCSDKLALKQCTSLLSGLTAVLINPSRMYLKTLVLPENEFVRSALDRAFSATGRMLVLATAHSHLAWPDSTYAFHPFEVQSTRLKFCSAKTEDAVPSNIAALRTGQWQQVMINGVLQGRKQSDARGATCVSRREMAKKLLELLESLRMPNILESKTSYAVLKEHSPARTAIKRQVQSVALYPWKRNDGDDDWPI